MIEVNREILSFKEIPAIAADSQRTALMLRHSYRQSLVNGNYDPPLTSEGWDFAVECGKLLRGMTDVCFGASSRLRTIQTIEAIIQGGGFASGTPITPIPQLHDTAIFSPPENLAIAIEKGTIPALFREYFSTGSAPGMRPMKEFVTELQELLTGSFPSPNVIVATHDVVAAPLLLSLKVYDFTQKDWCGYVQGAFLWQKDDRWTIAYAVPDKENRPLTELFV